MNFTHPARIDLAALGRGTPAMSPAACAHLAEAAAVCFVDRGHASGVHLHFDGSAAPVTWDSLDERASATHADTQEATENGAVAVAIQLIRGGTSLEVVRRSRKGTGFDYYLGRKDGNSPFGDSACLEVSGILTEDSRTLAERVKTKLRQVERGGAGLPGFVVVVGFSQPRATVEEFS